MLGPAPDAEPRIIGRYALYDEIASGGMATVHLGRLLGPVGFSRTVAIKRLQPHFARDAEFVTMFLDEARLAARVRHPNVVQTLDVVAEKGELFLVMDYVQGEPLSRLRKTASTRGVPLPPRIAISVMCGALLGLHAAHEAKSDRGESLAIVHRDVSPQNIVVGVDGIARVLDFGVAKAIGRAHATRDGALKGKLAYMSPEQLEGNVTRRSDVFAAAIVLWEALTGERLFTGDEAEVFGKVLRMDIPPPSRHMGQAADDLTPAQLDELDRVTLRGLERRPQDRFQTAREMALALERCIGVASPTEVGEWVETIAGDLLSERARTVAMIESHSSGLRPAPARDEAPLEITRSTPMDEETRAAAVVPIAPAAAGHRARSGRTTALAVGALVAAALFAAAWIGLRPAKTTALASPAPVASPDTPAATSAPPPPRAPEPPASAAPVTLAAAPSAAAPPAAPRASPVHRTARPASRPRASCDPPYTVDEAGRQHFKEECLR